MWLMEIDQMLVGDIYETRQDAEEQMKFWILEEGEKLEQYKIWETTLEEIEKLFGKGVS